MDYKQITSSLEGRLCLSTKKNGTATQLDEPQDYFQSRPEALHTVTVHPSCTTTFPFSSSISTLSSSSVDSQNIEASPQQPNQPAKDQHIIPLEHRPTPSRTDDLALSIELAEPTIFLHGYDVLESASHHPAVIRGVVRLKVFKHVALRTLNLVLRGTSESIWPEAWRVRRLKRIYKEQLLLHEWDFLHQAGTISPCVPARDLDPGVHEFPFDFPIDSTVPESIKLPLGGTCYSMTACATQTGTSSRPQSVSRMINLVRVPSAGSLEQVEPYGAHGFQDGIRYRIMLHGKSFRVGSQVPLSVHIKPQADRSWLRLRISLLEEVHYQTRDGLAQRHQCGTKATLLERLAESPKSSIARSSLRCISTAGESMITSYAGSAIIEKPRPQSAERQTSQSEHEAESRDLREKLVFQLPNCSQIHADTAYSCLYVRHILVVCQNTSLLC